MSGPRAGRPGSTSRCSGDAGYGQRHSMPRVHRMALFAMALCSLVLATVVLPMEARAAEIRLSAPGAAPSGVQLSGVWAAWEDYNVVPAVVNWHNLETGAAGTVEIPGLEVRRGTQWILGDGFLAWYLWSEDLEGRLYTEHLLTHEQRELRAPPDGVGLATDDSLLYWSEGGLLHRLNPSTGATATLAAAGVPYDFDVGGDWLAWTVFEERDPDAAEFRGYIGTVRARNLVTEEELVLGSFFWGTGQEPPQVPLVDGRWVVWCGYPSPVTPFTLTDKVAYAYDLEARQPIALDARIGAGQNPNHIRVSDGWIVWVDTQDQSVRSYVMDLTDPAAVPIPVAKTPGSQYAGRIAFPWVVWADDRGNGGEFAVYARRVDEAPAEAFSDIAGSPYRMAIESLAATNVIGGYGDGTFRAANLVLRAQFAKMIDLSLGLGVYEGAETVPFTDVERPDDDLYPDDYVAVAAANGLIKGFGGGIFRPYTPISRAQLLTMVVRAAEGFHLTSLQAPPPGWTGELPADDPTHGLNIRRAEYSGLLAGIDLANFDVWGNATRGEVAQVLWNTTALKEGIPAAWFLYTNPYEAPSVEVMLGVLGGDLHPLIGEDFYEGGYFITGYWWNRDGVRYAVVNSTYFTDEGNEDAQFPTVGIAKIYQSNGNTWYVWVTGDAPGPERQQLAEAAALLIADRVNSE